MFRALFIYKYFKDKALSNNLFSLAKEIYSMETRSLAIASAETKNFAFIIKHNRFEALPYPRDSLNIKNEPIDVENILNKVAIRDKNIKPISQ